MATAWEHPDFDRAMEEAAHRDVSIPSIPEIIINDLHLHELTSLALPAMARYNNPPTIFVRSGQLVRIRLDESNSAIIEVLSESALRGYLSRCARFVAYVPGEREPKPTDPSVKLVK